MSVLTHNFGTNAGANARTNFDSAADNDLAGNLRQMIAVLEQERQALATLNADELFEASDRKQALCDTLRPFGANALDPQSRELAKTAQALNDVNRRVRNLLAANVSARLEALGTSQHTYSPTNTAHA